MRMEWLYGWNVENCLARLSRPGEIHMTELGRLEDLPADYVGALRAQNLVPLWPSLRALLPPARPQPRRAPRTGRTKRCVRCC